MDFVNCSTPGHVTIPHPRTSKCRHAEEVALPRTYGDTFQDSLGNEVEVRQSSVVYPKERDPAVWVFCKRNPEHIGAAEATPRLTVEQAKLLVEGLQAFINATSARTKAKP